MVYTYKHYKQGTRKLEYIDMFIYKLYSKHNCSLGPLDVSSWLRYELP